MIDHTSSFKPVLALECTRAEVEFIAQTFFELCTQLSGVTDPEAPGVLIYQGRLRSIKALVANKAKTQHRCFLFPSELYGLTLTTDVMNRVLRLEVSYNLTKGPEVVRRSLTLLLGSPAPLEVSMAQTLGL